MNTSWWSTIKFRGNFSRTHKILDVRVNVGLLIQNLMKLARYSLVISFHSSNGAQNLQSWADWGWENDVDWHGKMFCPMNGIFKLITNHGIGIHHHTPLSNVKKSTVLQICLYFQKLCIIPSRRFSLPKVNHRNGETGIDISSYGAGLPHWCVSLDTERCLPLAGQVLSVPRYGLQLGGWHPWPSHFGYIQISSCPPQIHKPPGCLVVGYHHGIKSSLFGVH
jgi:hypothetical protein